MSTHVRTTSFITPTHSSPTHSSGPSRRSAIRSLAASPLGFAVSFVAPLAFVFIASALALAGCSPSDRDPTPDAVPSSIPTLLQGDYDVTTAFDLATLPPPAAELLGTLTDATDNPDDPAHYLVDRMVAMMPEGAPKAYASGLAAYVAPYIQIQIDRVAPKFSPGIRTIVQELDQIGRQFATLEELHINYDGTATRTVTGLALGSASVELSPANRIDATGTTRATVDLDGTVKLDEHQLQLPYGEILTLALDRAVIPSMDMNATDLADVLRDLVDCDALGEIFADKAGIGSPQLYSTACQGAMLGLASEVYARLHAIDDMPFSIDVAGAALGVDWNGDATMDELRSGTWTGDAWYGGESGPIGRSVFAGKRK
ncbi:MAG TPA: hypothetical protein VGM90_05450 [Kofleriaceae bacterium]|jgi:hypothetical protein